MSKSKIVAMLNKDGVFGIELIKLRRKTALANPNAEGLQETKELAGLSPFVYINLIGFFTLCVYDSLCEGLESCLVSLSQPTSVENN